MFDRYVLTLEQKQGRGPWLIADEVTLFGLYMYIFVSGFMPDPTKGKGRMVYQRIHKGIISRLIEKLKS